MPREAPSSVEIPSESLSDFPLLLMTAILAVTLQAVVPSASLGPGPARVVPEQLQQEVNSLVRALGDRAARARARESSLRSEVARKRRELAGLEARQREAAAPRVSELVGAPVAVDSTKSAILFELSGGRAVLVNDENYSVDGWTKPDGRHVVVRTLRVAGETIDDVTHGDSEFARTLRDLDVGEERLSLIVRPDSFAMFRKVRELARLRGIEVGWEPFPHQEGKIYSSRGGRDTRVQP